MERSPAWDIIPTIEYENGRSENESYTINWIRKHGGSPIDQLSWAEIDLILKRIKAKNPYLKPES